MSTTDGSIELANGCIYLVLHLRDGLPGFHWNFFALTAEGNEQNWHHTCGAEDRLDKVCIIYKVGSVTADDWADFNTVMNRVVTNGIRSLNTPLEPSDCAAWAQNALIALHYTGFIKLPVSIADFEWQVTQIAEVNRDPIEAGNGQVYVIDATNFSRTV